MPITNDTPNRESKRRTLRRILDYLQDLNAITGLDVIQHIHRNTNAVEENTKAIRTMHSDMADAIRQLNSDLVQVITGDQFASIKARLVGNTEATKIQETSRPGDNPVPAKPAAIESWADRVAESDKKTRTTVKASQEQLDRFNEAIDNTATDQDGYAYYRLLSSSENDLIEQIRSYAGANRLDVHATGFFSGMITWHLGDDFLTTRYIHLNQPAQ